MQCTGLDMIIYVLSQFLCTMQKTPIVSNLAVRTSVPHCLLKNVTPSNFSSLFSPLGGASMNSGVCCEVYFFFLLHGMLLINLFLVILSIKREENLDNKSLLLI